MDNLVIDLYNKNCIKFGKFTLKNGTTSPIYIDLKNIITYPYLVNLISNFFINEIKSIETDYICGVPYGGIPLASLISNKNNIPMLMVRKEIKSYGLKKSIEGEYDRGKSCILIEDTITTGGSIQKFVNLLSIEGILVKDVFVICDRRDKNTVPPLGYTIHSLFDITYVFKTLKKNGYINFSDINMNYLKNFIYKKYGNFVDLQTKKKTLKSRDKTCSALISIILKKQTNLCFSVCIQEEIEIGELVKTIGKIGKHICILKINSNNIKGIQNNPGYKNALLKMANEMEFMIYDDQKFSRESDLTSPWCNLTSVFGLENLVNQVDSFKNKEKMEGVFDYKGFVVSNFIEPAFISKNNIILYEGQNIVNCVKEKNNSLFLSDTIFLDIQNFDELSKKYEEYLIEKDFDLISISKNIKDGDELEKFIILSKTISWTIYNKKIQ
jgi:orotate phosphoribosyltransferase